MLRVSSEALGLGIDIAVVAKGTPPSLPHGAEILALVDALTTRSDAEPVAERAALIAAAGPAVAERAVSVCATFGTMNRLLDGVGAPVRAALHPIAETLGFDPQDLPR
jgi:hypothetical protein